MPKVLEELDHNDNDLHFTFSLDHTPIEGHIYYRYRLNNGSWSAWSTNTTANFVNLTHGYYTFSVQARDITNRLTDITSIQFVIKTPFYLRWYMNLVYVLLLLVLFYLLFRLRLRKLGKDKERLERLVQERTAEVVRLEKMATVGKLTQGLIDRILNPLNYINNFAKLSEGLVKDVKANVDDEKEHMDAENYEDTLDVLEMLSGNLQKVGEHGQNTTRTLKAMEEMLKDRSGGIVPMNLATVIRQDEQMLLEYYKNEIAQHHIKTVFDYPETIQMDGNAEQLSKTIMCMLGNSVYAIVKKAQKASFSPELSLHAAQSGDSVKVVIRDNGIGIEETILNKIFDPFFTTKTTGEASGVGLYLSREIIQNHGGDISVKSVKDEYTEFTVIIPLKKA
jgi:signal transduction histidine kinase